MASPFRARVRDVVYTNGREVMILDNGSRYLIVTPGERAGRSLTLDLAIIDEAFAQEDHGLVGAIQPTMVARPQAQLWMLSNAGSRRSGLWRHYTDIGRATFDQPDARLCWIEYAPGDHAAVDDPAAWAAANPTLGLRGGVTAEALADAAATMVESTFRREHLNQWTDDADLVGLDPVAWAGCADLDAAVGTDLVLAFDVTPDRGAGTIVAAGPLPDGRVAVELIDQASDMDRLVGRLLEVAARWGAPVVLDRRSGAASVRPALERAGVTVQLLAGPDVTAACGAIDDAVKGGRLAHRADPRLTEAVVVAARRRVGDAWQWQPRGLVDLTPLTAATLAHWAVAAAPDPVVPNIH